ncbi:ubiquitin-specific protease ubp15 [Asimina triloba]
MELKYQKLANDEAGLVCGLYAVKDEGTGHESAGGGDMLEPREADIPALFLVLVVLPLVTYILLGMWNEAAKKNAKIGMLAQLASEEAFRVEALTTASVIPVPVVSSLKSGLHPCARCFSPAKTRCSRCKTVRYCSGRCQIVHWRQGHKDECTQVYDNDSKVGCADHVSTKEYVHPRSSFLKSNIKGGPILHPRPLGVSLDPPITTAAAAAIPSGDASQVFKMERRFSDKSASSKLDRESFKHEDASPVASYAEADIRGASVPTLNTTAISAFPQSKESPVKKKVPTSTSYPNNMCIIVDELYTVSSGINSSVASANDNQSSPAIPVHGHAVPRNALHPPYTLTGHNGCLYESSSTSGISSSTYLGRSSFQTDEIEMCLRPDNGGFIKESFVGNETPRLSSSSEKASVKVSKKPKSPCPTISASQGSVLKTSQEQSCPGIERKVACLANGSNTHQSGANVAVPAQSNSGISKMGDAMMMGLKKLPKLSRWDALGTACDGLKRNQMLFPYEELVKFFHWEIWDLSPRGLLNCGNREGGGSLSPSRILSHMRNIGCRMGGGDQEDAHEFLRLLLTSMQSICLEGLGGEKVVDPSLQETTLIQQIFGGRLRSKVKCLKCHHESERYENIMDLTLEILGWVESLEDALTQFTSSEDLDGENMYRCGRCAGYVKARKQLSIHEAPNILTIVLKRFQTGKYGKINKCITFPEMLDMIPFMTGTGDSRPPLYMLYGVVVHLDNLNASFSGHYVSYVKDLRGTWLRIDDTEVEPVPMSRVMSEGAYILFYSRSHPRPPRAHVRRHTPLQAPFLAKRYIPKPQKSSRHGECKPNGSMFTSEHPAPPIVPCRNICPAEESYVDSICTDFSDATSSDWSLFTSSDESSFTTESTRDSFSTIDYTDPLNTDPISSIFRPLYTTPEYTSSTISCKMSSPCRPHTEFFRETTGFAVDSSMPSPPLGNVHRGRIQTLRSRLKGVDENIIPTLESSDKAPKEEERCAAYEEDGKERAYTPMMGIHMEASHWLKEVH